MTASREEVSFWDEENDLELGSGGRGRWLRDT